MSWDLRVIRFADEQIDRVRSPAAAAADSS